jgi:hypothetical protein
MMKHTKAELEAVIFYLENQLREKEKRLQVYEQHFKSCRTASPLSPPSSHDNHDETSVDKTSSISLSPPTLEETPANGQGSANTTDSTVLTGLENIPVQNTALISTGILHDHGVSNGGQISGPRKRKKWEDDASSFLVNTKRSRHLRQCLEALPRQDAIISAIVCGTTCDRQALPTLNPTTDPIIAAKVYANITCASRAKADLVSRIASFQDLIFHSICAVLEYCAYPTEEIDGVMRITSSNSGPKNLKRLRAGAIWASEVISESTKGGWNDLSDRIAELYFLCECFITA